MSLFQGSTALTIDGSITAITILDTAGTLPVEIVQEGDPWSVKIDWEVHGLGVLLLPGSTWEVSLRLEGWGGAPESDIGPVTVTIPTVTVPSPNPFTVTIPVAAQPVGLYKLAAMAQIINSVGMPVPVAGQVEGPMVQVFKK